MSQPPNELHRALARPPGAAQHRRGGLARLGGHAIGAATDVLLKPVAQSSTMQYRWPISISNRYSDKSLHSPSTNRLNRRRQHRGMNMDFYCQKHCQHRARSSPPHQHNRMGYAVGGHALGWMPLITSLSAASSDLNVRGFSASNQSTTLIPSSICQCSTDTRPFDRFPRNSNP